MESNNQLQVFYTQSISALPETVPMLEGMSAYISSANSIILNKAKTFSGELNFWYQFAGVDGVDKTNSYYNVDAGIRLKTRNKKM